MKLLFIIFLMSFVIGGNAIAHVQLDQPQGGETYVSGATVLIKWSLVQSHQQENWDLYFSSDGGTTWEDLQLNMENSKFTYIWTVPDLLTETARIKIVQDNAGADYQDVSGDFIISDTPASIELPEKNPKAFALHANYPNPFNPSTIINYELPTTNDVNLSVYNSLGQIVVTLVSGKQEAGHHQVEWEATGFASGIYFYRIEAGEFQAVKRMVLLR